jgi:hypothetical protein
LKEQAGIFTIITKTDPNPQQAPFKPWRIVFYVPGDVEQLGAFLQILDMYFVHRATNPLQGVDKKPWPPRADLTVHVHPHVEVELTAKVEAFTVANKICHPQSNNLPLKLFEANPPAGNKIILVRMELVSDTAVAMTFEGRIWNLRYRFDAAGVPLTGNEGMPRMRLINEEAGDLSLDGTIDTLLGIFGNTVLRGHVCCVRMDETQPEEGTPVHAFLLQLRGMNHVYFDTV